MGIIFAVLVMIEFEIYNVHFMINTFYVIFYISRIQTHQGVFTKATHYPPIYSYCALKAYPRFCLLLDLRSRFMVCLCAEDALILLTSFLQMIACYFAKLKKTSANSY